ncbi:acyl-CoA N-acyltransferase [Thozetella sp. PMI_491]|nr:acyl-CoA N-acyltransferase [Thozetella sp. PMI_491]
MTYQIAKATPEDAEGIAEVFVQTGDSEFLRLQIGTADIQEVIQSMADGVKRSFQSDGQLTIVAREEGTGKVLSFAQWTLPNDEPDKTPEEIEKEVERRLQYIKPGMNQDFIVEIWKKMWDLRTRALKGRRNYLLGNLGTRPEYRRQGIATKLVEFVLEQSDEAGEIAYLDTEETGTALSIYERLGFKKVTEVHFDLTQHGGAQADHVHVAMIREPRGATAADAAMAA